MENFIDYIKKKPWLLLFLGAAIFWIWMLIAQIEMPLSNPFFTLVLLGLGILLCGLLYFFCVANQNLRYRFFALILAALMGAGCFMQIQHTNTQASLFDTICSMPEQYVQKGGFYAYSQAPVASLKSLKNEEIGYIAGRNAAFEEQARQVLQDENSQARLKSYQTIPTLMKALKGQAIRAVLLGPSDLELMQEFSGLEQIGKQLNLIESVAVESGTGIEPKEGLSQNSPYTLLISCTMDDLDQDAYRSILTMVLCVNPAASQTMVIVLPENLWIGYGCQADNQQGCAEGRADKLGFASFYTLDVLKATVENILGMNIDYSMKVDLSTLADLAGILGPVKVQNDSEFSDGSYLFQAGEVELTPAKIRSFVSYNHDFSLMENDYGQRQKRALSALLKELNEPAALSSDEVRNILVSSIRTNLSASQFNALLTSQFKQGLDSADEAVITGEQAAEHSSELTDSIPIYYVNGDSVNQAKEKAEAVLNQNVEDQSQQPEENEEKEQEQQEDQPAGENADDQENNTDE